MRVFVYQAIDIRKHWIEPKRHQINAGFLLAVFLHISLASMLADNVLAWEIVPKIQIFSLIALLFSQIFIFQTNSQPPKGVYLLNSGNSGRVK